MSSWVCDAGLGGYGLPDSHPLMDAAWRRATLDTSEEDFLEFREEERRQEEEWHQECIDAAEKQWDNAKEIVSGDIDWDQFVPGWIETNPWVGPSEDEIIYHSGCICNNHYEVRWDAEKDELLMKVLLYQEPENYDCPNLSEPATTTWQDVFELIERSDEVEFQCRLEYFNKHLRLEFMENLTLPEMTAEFLRNKKLEKERKKKEELGLISIQKKLPDDDDVLEYFRKLGEEG